MENKVEDLLIKMGIYPNLSGFNYICKAVSYIIGESSARTRHIYKTVAKDFETTESRVERAIRHAFSKADEDSEAYKKYIGIKHTSNLEMLYTLANKIKRT